MSYGEVAGSDAQAVHTKPAKSEHKYFLTHQNICTQPNLDIVSWCCGEDWVSDS